MSFIPQSPVQSIESTSHIDNLTLITSFLCDLELGIRKKSGQYEKIWPWTFLPWFFFSYFVHELTFMNFSMQISIPLTLAKYPRLISGGFRSQDLAKWDKYVSLQYPSFTAPLLHSLASSFVDITPLSSPWNDNCRSMIWFVWWARKNCTKNIWTIYLFLFHYRLPPNLPVVFKFIYKKSLSAWDLTLFKLEIRIVFTWVEFRRRR